MIRALTALSLLLAACGVNRDKDETRSVFSYNEINAVTNLDPAGASNLENIWPVNQLFNSLLEMDDRLSLRPSLAHSWEISGDGLTYTFFLRKDILFHRDKCFVKGTRTVVAADFVYSFNRLYDSRISSAASLLDVVNNKKGERGFEAVNDSVFRVYLQRPFSAFASILTMKYFSVVPHEAVDHYGEEFRRHPVGTGPFMFRAWPEGTRVILVKNPDYFERDENGTTLPYLDAVSISMIRDRETAFMEMLGGNFDMLSGADAFNTNEVLDREGNLRPVFSSRFTLQKGSFLKTDYIGILCDPALPAVKGSPLLDRRVRQAINYAIDRKKLIKHLRNNLGSAAPSGFIPPGMKSYDPNAVKGYEYNPEKARKLLAEAGYPGGKGLPVLVLHVSDQYREQVEYMQAQLAACNIQVEISIEKTAVLRQAVNRGEYALFKKSWVADYADEENFMSLFYSRNFSPHGVNYFHYANPGFDKLYEEALALPYGDERTRLYQEMERVVIGDAPFIAMYYDDVVRIVNRGVSGLTTNPMNLLDLRRVKKSRQ